MGNGRSLSQLAFSVSSFPFVAAVPNIMNILLILAVMKMVVTLLVLRYGASGGVLQPSISTGACFGAILYTAFSSTFDISQVSAISVAIIGAASLLASSRKAPIMAWLLVAELVNAQFELLFLMLFAVIVSSCVSNCIEYFISHFCFTVTHTR